MRPVLIFIALVLFILLSDLFVLRGIRYLAQIPRDAYTFNLVFWSVSALILACLGWVAFSFRNMRNPAIYMAISVGLGVVLSLYVPAMVFNLAQLLGGLAAWVAGSAGGSPDVVRRGFLIPGTVLAAILFASFVLGMVRGRTRVKVFSEQIPVQTLPGGLDGIRIVQLSDFHLAGFYFQPGYIEKVVSRVNSLQPGLILFTGDMIHNFSDELEPFTGILNRLKAPLGKFAVLGNHDYGRYYRWPTPEDLKKNLDRTKDLIRQSGFDLLLNENRTISLNGDSLEILGVENWGKPPFPQEGDLERSLEGSDPGLPKILLSHDPSHWDLKVRGREPIFLTLSGHTHGMQFGIEAGNFRWSPSAWTYKYWGGLYREKEQYLYVNRGLGFTGFPGRVGIRPEITLLTLRAGKPPAH